MFKKVMLIAGAAVALIAMSAPIASASIYDKGTALKAGENFTVLATGTAQFASGAGGVHCSTTEAGATAELELTGGTTDGHVKEFTVENPTKCEVSGALVFLSGGTTTLKTVELTKDATATVVGDNLTVTNIELFNEFHNGLKFHLDSIDTETTKHDVVATPDNAAAIKTLSLSGTLTNTLNNSIVTVTGDLDVVGTDSGTYGTTAS